MWKERLARTGDFCLITWKKSSEISKLYIFHDNLDDEMIIVCRGRDYILLYVSLIDKQGGNERIISYYLVCVIFSCESSNSTSVGSKFLFWSLLCPATIIDFFFCTFSFYLCVPWIRWMEMWVKSHVCICLGLIQVDVDDNVVPRGSRAPWTCTRDYHNVGV